MSGNSPNSQFSQFSSEESPKADSRCLTKYFEYQCASMSELENTNLLPGRGEAQQVEDGGGEVVHAWSGSRTPTWSHSLLTWLPAARLYISLHYVNCDPNLTPVTWATPSHCCNIQMILFSCNVDKPCKRRHCMHLTVDKIN